MISADANMSELDRYVIRKVKEFRVRKGLSQSALAAKLEVSDTFIGDIENPKSRAKYNLTHINKLAKVFGCSPRDFFPEQPLE
jgi:transcriptional regulator with XRE-family HTH domain